VSGVGRVEDRGGKRVTAVGTRRAGGPVANRRSATGSRAECRIGTGGSLEIINVSAMHSARIEKLFALLLLFVCGEILCAEDKPYAPEQVEGATIVSAEEAIELILADPELVVVDARKKTEFIKGHIEGAVNILNTELTRERLEAVAPDPGRHLMFYCNGVRCLRSSDSIEKAIGWGYRNIYWLRGGWKEWTEKRLPVVTD
jgi:rhodanese-related sulfurtransferase